MLQKGERGSAKSVPDAASRRFRLKRNKHYFGHDAGWIFAGRSVSKRPQDFFSAVVFVYTHSLGWFFVRQRHARFGPFSRECAQEGL